MISRNRPITSIFKYLVFLIICGTAACDDDTPANTNDTASLADTNALSDVPDTSNEIDAVPLDVAEADDTIGRPDTTGGTGVTTDPAAVSTSTVDGHSRTLIDAASSAHWTHLSLFSGALAVPAPVGTDSWHISFQRFLVKVGPEVRAAVVDGTTFADLSTAPDGPWTTDDLTTDPAVYALGAWYDYNGQTHTLAPKPDRVFVIHADARYFKLRYRDYYDAGGSPGYLTIDWAEIDPPAPAVTTRTLALPLGEGFAYANLRTHTVLETAPTEGDSNWDLGARSVSLQTNSGTSGAGLGGAYLLGDGELADFTSYPAEAPFTTDAMAAIAGPPGSGEASRNSILDKFYNYDPTTHAITVKPTVFAVRLADGSTVKVRFTAWSRTELSFEYAPIVAADE